MCTAKYNLWTLRELNIKVLKFSVSNNIFCSVYFLNEISI